MSQELRTAGVVGLGVMGFDIAFLYAMKGYRTAVFDVSKAALDAVTDRREQTIERLEKRKRISGEEADRVRTHLTACADLAGLARSDLVTEAVSENAATKAAVYRALKGAGFSGILTTNTSSVTRATLLGDGSFDRRKFALTHFFNPVLYTRMVEVVRGDMEDAGFKSLITFLEGLGRAPVETRDISGFVSNGILMVYAVMAVRLLECGARIEEVDRAAKELRLLPPFVSFDSWKPSIVEDVTRAMFELRGDSFLRSSKFLGLLARNNPPFYSDQQPNPKIYELAGARAQTLDGTGIQRALKISLLVAAARVVELGESPDTVDFVAREGLKIPEAPLKEIDALGAAKVIEELSRVNRDLPEPPLAPPQILVAMAETGESFYKDGQANPWLSSHSEQAIRHARH